jgi:drug/metabolite transporter (DMT)-like permease
VETIAVATLRRKNYIRSLDSNPNFLKSGVRSMFLSTAAFFAANVCVKQVSHIPAMETVFFRCTVATLICVYGIRRAGASMLGNNHAMLLLRGMFGTTALFFFFVTLQHIPLATAQTIQYLSPVFTATIAIFVLKEGVLPAQWIFYAMAFAGVLMIEQLDARVSAIYLVMGIVSAFCSGVAYNLVRSLRGREHGLTVVLHFQLVGAVAGLAGLYFDWRTPSGWDWLYLLLIGVFSQLGQIFLTHALQTERIAGVAIINYTGLVYAIVVGWAVFGETQGPASIAGMALVVLGVMCSVLYGRRRERLAALEVTAA